MLVANTLSPQILFAAIAGGVLPTFVWLYFWLRQCDTSKPRTLIGLSFVVGAIAVIITIPIQHVLHDTYGTWKWFVFIAAGCEEIIKYALIRIFVLRRSFIQRPVDYTVYLIAAALGFAALENTLYLLKPLIANDIPLALSTGNIRFLGSTVIHAVSSALFGLWMGIAFCRSGIFKFTSVIMAIITATALHGVFNYFIMSNNQLITVITLIATWVIMSAAIIAVHQASRVTTCPPH
jgi:RsiW-degrading membrane proteinase PrsW (M82 family)